MTIIAVMNQKGGVGKTTTAANLGMALSRRNQHTLLIDLDPQAHLTLHLGLNPDEEPSCYSLLTAGQRVAGLQRRLSDTLAILPAHVNLAAAESELVSVIGRETILRDALAGAEESYDYVLIDCPPSLGILTLNGLGAAGEILIPMQAHFLALQGVSKLLETVQLVRSRINPAIRVRGVLLCMYESTTRLGTEVLQDLKEFFAQARSTETPWSQARVFETVIRRNIKLAESPSHGLTVFDYAPKSHGALDYAALADEVLALYGHAGYSSPAVRLADDPTQTANQAPQADPSTAAPPRSEASPPLDAVEQAPAIRRLANSA